MSIRTTKQLKADLTRLTTAHLGFDGMTIEQGTEAWKQMRLGVITASRAKDLISKGRTAGSVGEARRSYMMDLIAEIATGKEKRNGFSARATTWGHEQESTCVGLYAFDAGVKIESIPFVYAHDSMRYGASPDGLIGDHSGIEAKNPFDTSVYLKFILDGEIKPEYIDQVQFSMFVTGRESWVFACHDPDLENYIYHSVVIERDETKMKTFADAVGQFVNDMDKRLSELDYIWGDQWRVICHQEAA